MNINFNQMTNLHNVRLLPNKLPDCCLFLWRPRYTFLFAEIFSRMR